MPEKIILSEEENGSILIHSRDGVPLARYSIIEDKIYGI
jgi:hypothetical protein